MPKECHDHGALMDQTAFAPQIRQALEHLHDFAYLQNLPLIEALDSTGQSLDRRVRRLRSELLDAIDRLKPGDALSPRAKEQRPYVLMYGRYVQGLETAELMDELAISLRQLRREQKRALAAITDLLWERFSAELDEPASMPGERWAVAEAEAEQLLNQAQLEDFDLAGVFEGVLTMLAPVAAKRGTTLKNWIPPALPSVRANRVILRQALLSLISYAIDYAGSGEVRLRGSADDRVALQIAATGPAQIDADTRLGVGLDVSRRLIIGLGGAVEILEDGPDWQVTLSFSPAKDTPILVMDDNAGLLSLFRRYLAGQSYRLFEAETTEQALHLARQIQPALIVLDVMMPEQDGWEVLQHLRAAPETADTPILICSVLNEPEIAEALGASDYLLKPVTQDALLAKVEQWCRPLPQPVA